MPLSGEPNAGPESISTRSGCGKLWRQSSLAPKPAGFYRLGSGAKGIRDRRIRTASLQLQTRCLRSVKNPCKSLVQCIGKSRRYSTTVDGVAKLAAYSTLRDHVIN